LLAPIASKATIVSAMISEEAENAEISTRANGGTTRRSGR